MPKWESHWIMYMKSFCWVTFFPSLVCLVGGHDRILAVQKQSYMYSLLYVLFHQLTAKQANPWEPQRANDPPHLDFLIIWLRIVMMCLLRLLYTVHCLYQRFMMFRIPWLEILLLTDCRGSVSLCGGWIWNILCVRARTCVNAHLHTFVCVLSKYWDSWKQKTGCLSGMIESLLSSLHVCVHVHLLRMNTLLLYFIFSLLLWFINV